MDIVSEQKDALAALGLTAFGFILLVATSGSHEYGLILSHGDGLVWSFTRVVPTMVWIALAGVLVLFRGAIFWTSAATAFMLTLVAGSLVAVLGAPVGINALSVMATVCYYALISAFLSLTLRSVLIAAIAGPVFLFLQVLTDILAHVGTGVLHIAL